MTTSEEFFEFLKSAWGGNVSQRTPFNVYKLKQWRTFPDVRNPKRMMTPRMCFRNAAKVAAKDPAALRYVEGWVTVYGVPIDHAWVYDVNTGIGWDYTAVIEEQLESHYYGIIIPPAVMQMVKQHIGWQYSSALPTLARMDYDDLERIKEMWDE